MLHSFKIPFSGQFLSLNQGFILSRSSLEGVKNTNNKLIPSSISNISALLKSLSPAGKKLTPMLAISAQGLLFNMGTLLFGVNPVGLSLGMVLLSLWAFLQPLLIYYILYGRTLIDVAHYFYIKINKFIPISEEMLITSITIIVGLKIFLSLITLFAAYLIPEQLIKKYFFKLVSIGKKRKLPNLQTNRSIWNKSLLALSDLFNPLFIFSLIVTLIFFILSESNISTITWALMRPIAIGFLLFFIIRICPLERLFPETNSSPFKQSFRIALLKIKNY